MEEIKYQVCIRCYTYNQSKYIIEALNSFVIQKTKFPFVIVVVDDASTDGEQEVIRQYINENFNIKDGDVSYERDTELSQIIYAKHSQNSNCYIAAALLKQNLYKEREKKSAIVDEWRLQSKYEAICEGDDWWISDNKLQRQFDILESHPEIDMCACGAIRMRDGKIDGFIQPSKEERILSTEETILGGGAFLATNSLMSRVSMFKDDFKFWRMMGLDYFNQIHGSLKGGIYFSPELMVAYRKNVEGSWSQNMKNHPETFFFHKAKVQEIRQLLNEETSYKYDNIIKRMIYKNYLSMFVLGVSNGLFDADINDLSLKQRLGIILKLIKKLI